MATASLLQIDFKICQYLASMDPPQKGISLVFQHCTFSGRKFLHGVTLIKKGFEIFKLS